jgi:hypothetical protein
MELTEKELLKLEQLNRWCNSKSRKILLLFLLAIIGLIFCYFIIFFLLGNIELKEILWVTFFLVVILIWCKAVFDLENNVKFLLHVIEKLKIKAS